MAAVGMLSFIDMIMVHISSAKTCVVNKTSAEVHCIMKKFIALSRSSLHYRIILILNSHGILLNHLKITERVTS